jgi:uncharacterized membrane protein YesL
MSQPQKPKGKVLFKVVKGFIYGNVLGLFFAIAIYLLSSAVTAIAPLPATPTILSAIIYSASVMAGVGVEYSNWLEEQA